MSIMMMHGFALLIAGCFLAATVASARAAEKCGPYERQVLNKETIEAIVSAHFRWLERYSEPDRGKYDARNDPLRANFSCASLRGVRFFADDLSFAEFSKADLQDANFDAAILRGSNLTNSKLQNASFILTDLSGSYFGGADVAGALFEPKSDALPSSIAMRRAVNLEWLRFEQNPDALLELRDSFKKAGRRDLERRVTFAIEHTRTNLAFAAGGWFAGAFRYLAWELPTGYDLSPHRALVSLLVLCLLFAIPYAVALSIDGKSKIWRVLPRDRRDGSGQELWEPLRATGLNCARYALLFSFISAFQFGWRELNVGNWISRLQPSEYSLRGSGWIRSVAGAQSLVSFYLLAMWALTFFGRLFDG